jgi:hypothetical protein
MAIKHKKVNKNLHGIFGFCNPEMREHCAYISNCKETTLNPKIFTNAVPNVNFKSAFKGVKISTPMQSP